MCKAIECPNHSDEKKYTWWGCGERETPASWHRAVTFADRYSCRSRSILGISDVTGGHIEQALAPYQKDQICDCEHEPIPSNPNVFQPKQK